MSDADLILVAGLMMAAGLAAAKVADRVRVPGLLLFLGLGMLLGSEGVGGVEFDDAELTRTLGTIGLILILFEGGLTAGWREIRPVVGTAASLAGFGTALTALITGLAAALFLDLSLIQGLIIGGAVATTDSAATFAVLRGSTLRRRLARTLEGESGMNDPVALLLVIGFIEIFRDPTYGVSDMAANLVVGLGLGVIAGLVIGRVARWVFRELYLPTPGLYPVASLGAAALAFGVAEWFGGSGFISVYIAALVLGTGSIPGKRTTIAFHQGTAWVAQISLFVLLGLLVDPSNLIDIAPEGLAISGVLMLLARPFAGFVAPGTASFSGRERLMLGWAGLRGAVPVWLATFPVIAGVAAGDVIFDVVFFVVVTSTLIQGATFEPLARKLGLTTDEPALPRPLVETGEIQLLGGDVVALRIAEDDAAVGHMVKELGLPREALVNVIVRDGEAIPPRGSTEIRAGDELHLLVRRTARSEVDRLIERWRAGPLGDPVPPPTRLRGAPLVFTVRQWSPRDGRLDRPGEIDGIRVASRLRTRRDAPGALVALADGRFAVTGSGIVAVGGRRQVAQWCVRRAQREGLTAQERAWWQEIVGVLTAPALSSSRR